ncbi:hypothetical protein NliqN6_5974 [Naganishia liquefaciens]|uniref:Uncharacterized protein n=1 Tax=Naganishia liquefaciens TaxID=104408 RepID=A0A8H3TYQ8_9TREE|nr:hypothetical protein NliqN6_5974 [Naganishia liquefaciens]
MPHKVHDDGHPSLRGGLSGSSGSTNERDGHRSRLTSPPWSALPGITHGASSHSSMSGASSDTYGSGSQGTSNVDAVSGSSGLSKLVECPDRLKHRETTLAGTMVRDQFEIEVDGQPKLLVITTIWRHGRNRLEGTAVLHFILAKPNLQNGRIIDHVERKTLLVQDDENTRDIGESWIFDIWPCLLQNSADEQWISRCFNDLLKPTGDASPKLLSDIRKAYDGLMSEVARAD